MGLREHAHYNPGSETDREDLDLAVHRMSQLN